MQLISSDLEPERTVLRVSPEDLLKVAALAARWPAVFSCNSQGSVWATGRAGQGRGLEARSPLLQVAGGLVRMGRAAGGKFAIDDVGIRRVKDGQRIAVFAIAS